jgi:cytochrome c5
LTPVIAGIASGDGAIVDAGQHRPPRSGVRQQEEKEEITMDDTHRIPLFASIPRLAAAGAVAACFALPAWADPDRPGKEIFDETCVACHGTGAQGAPRVGDRKAWQARYAHGLTALSQHAIEGIRKMPSHGGKMTLTNLEIERAITYMVNQSGARWNEPINRSRMPASRSGEYVVRTQCAKCHQEGLGGAPRIGDSTEWIRRAQQGFDSLVRSAINGHGGMPARGGEADLTDPELRLAITYMFQTSVAHVRYGPVSGGADGDAAPTGKVGAH